VRVRISVGIKVRLVIVAHRLIAHQLIAHRHPSTVMSALSDLSAF